MGHFRVWLWMAPLLLTPLHLDAGSSDPEGRSPQVAPMPEEGTVTIKGIRLYAELLGRPGRTARVKLRSFNSGQTEVAMAVRVQLMEVAESSGMERMEPQDRVLSSAKIELELSPQMDQDREIVLSGLHLSPQRVSRLLAKHKLYVQVIEEGESEDSEQES
jgi:hypothetical protein